MNLVLNLVLTRWCLGSAPLAVVLAAAAVVVAAAAVVAAVSVAAAVTAVVG